MKITARSITPLFLGGFLFIYQPQLKSQSSQTKEEKIEIVDTPFEKGKIRDGNKSGVWMYYDTPNELALKINYTSGQLQFLKKDTSEYAVKVNDEWISMKLDAQPRYIGSMNDFKKVYDEIKLPQEFYDNKISGTFYISFTIDTLGRAVNYQAINELSPGISQSIINALQTLPNYWLVAQKGGQHYEANLIVSVTITIVNDGVVAKPKNKPMSGVDIFYPFEISLKSVTREKRSMGYGNY